MLINTLYIYETSLRNTVPLHWRYIHMHLNKHFVFFNHIMICLSHTNQINVNHDFHTYQYTYSRCGYLYINSLCYQTNWVCVVCSHSHSVCWPIWNLLDFATVRLYSPMVGAMPLTIAGCRKHYLYRCDVTLIKLWWNIKALLRNNYIN